MLEFLSAGPIIPDLFEDFSLSLTSPRNSPSLSLAPLRTPLIQKVITTMITACFHQRLMPESNKHVVSSSGTGWDASK